MAGNNFKKFIGRKGKVYNARWEEAFDRILTPFEEFIHRQTTSGVLLMICAVIALVVANSQFYPVYEHILKTYAGISIGDGGLKMSIHHWVNDGLMAFSFSMWVLNSNVNSLSVSFPTLNMRYCRSWLP